jgi:ribonuclease Z
VRRLVLTHFSQRYEDPIVFAAEAARHFDGDIVVAEDLMRVAVPPRR